MTDAPIPIRRALISVSDKTDMVRFARALADRGVEILSTGGSARALVEAGVHAREVAEYTGVPEIMGGRVKTLHPKIHGALLARRDVEDDMEALTDYSILPIDLLVGNLYPFEQTMAGGADLPSIIENIDIGGVAMIRAAAKNHDFVTVATDPAQYDAVIRDMENHDGAVSAALRRRLAAAAFARTAAYDAAIAAWFAETLGDVLPERFIVGGQRLQTLRYGENPHQVAAVYRTGDRRAGIATAQQVQGKELSYNNIADADAALELVAEFDQPAVAIIKHGTPCGVAVADRLIEAWLRACACDPISAFGGIVAMNRPLDAVTAAALVEPFLEVVVAPGADPEALAALGAKANLRVLLVDAVPTGEDGGLTMRAVAGGLLVQGRDTVRVAPDAMDVVTRRQPTDAELADMAMAFAVVKHVRSNAIVLAKHGATVGVGAGQTSRVDSVHLAARKAAEAAARDGEPVSRAVGAVLASDAFFPFADGLEAGIEAGITAAIQPGGSMRDQDVIDAADRAGIAMVFTGQRHFRH